MKLRSAACIGLCLGFAAQSAAAQDKPRPDDHPPIAALTSPSAAVKVAFEEVCLPAILDGQPVETLAIQRHLVSVNPKLAGFSGEVKTWRLASLGQVYVAAWSDGTCSVTSERGDPEALRQQVLDAMAARGIRLTAGLAQPAKADGINQAYCEAGSHPLVLSIITPVDKKSRRGAVFTNLFRARGERPSFCTP
jgi:hypothetical protein